jgi:hypothetical protein
MMAFRLREFHAPEDHTRFRCSRVFGSDRQNFGTPFIGPNEPIGQVPTTRRAGLKQNTEAEDVGNVNADSPAVQDDLWAADLMNAGIAVQIQPPIAVHWLPP